MGGLAFLAVSCGDGKPALYPVKGRVVDDKGKPAFNAMVVFEPADSTKLPNIRPSGRVNEAGDFVVTTYAKDDGAPAGEYGVRVFWQLPQTSPFDGDGPDILQGRYNDPKAPAFSFTVENKPDNEVPEIKVVVPPRKK
jgi:hypothetical protein